LVDALAAGIGAGMPDPMVLVPMPVEPMGALLGDIVLPELDESVDGAGVAAGAGITVVFVVSSFLLQAPSASKAAKATEVTTRVLRVGVSMKFP
jgi:hypothetical protein